DQIRRRARYNLAALNEHLRGSLIRSLQVEGGWYATIQPPRVRTAEEWTLELLAQRDVLVQPGYFYDFDEESLLVLSLLTPERVFDEGVRRLLEHVTEAVG